MTMMPVLAEPRSAAVESAAPPVPPESIADQLRSTHLFAELEPGRLRDLVEDCVVLEVGEGQVVVEEGALGSELFMVVRGRLQVSQKRDGAADLLLGEVRAGEFFGERGLLEETRRMATVRAVTSCRLVALSRAGLERFLERHPALREGLEQTLLYRQQWQAARRFRPEPQEIMKELQKIFGEVSPDVLEALGDEVQWVTLPRHATLLRHGDPGDCLYFVMSGRLRVFVRRDDGEELRLGELGPGESVGEMALLSSEPRSATVAALRDAELLRLSKVGFHRLLQTHPEAMGRFTKVIVERLNQRIRARTVITQLRTNSVVTPEECDEIASTENLVLRNLKITQMYHRLSLELSLLLGHQDANWCTFACNASKTAGYSIRKEELPLYETFMRLLSRENVRTCVDFVGRYVDRAGLSSRVVLILGTVSDTISAGNLKVFAELAPIFARMIRSFHEDKDYDSAKLTGFLSTLRPGPTEAGGQDTLAEALTHYYEAMFERSPKRKAQLILLGNIKVGLHEQMRLQPNIVDALNAPLRVGLGGVLSGRLLPSDGTRLFPRARARLASSLDAYEERVLQRATAVWRRLITQSLMTLRLPYSTVRLGADVPRLPNHRLFPDMLQELEHPELLQVVDKYDYAKSTGRGSRAADWGELNDRMNFIVNLFRSRQNSLELFGQPFLMEQREEMAAGRVPVGRL